MSSYAEPRNQSKAEVLSLPWHDASPESVAKVLTPDTITRRLIFCPKTTDDIIDFEGPFEPGFFFITGSRPHDKLDLSANVWQQGRSNTGVELGNYFLQAIGNPVLFPHKLFDCQIVTERLNPDVYYSILKVLGSNTAEVAGAEICDTSSNLLRQEFGFKRVHMPPIDTSDGEKFE